MGHGQLCAVWCGLLAMGRIASSTCAEELNVSAPLALHSGSLVVVHRAGTASQGLLIHFHGAPETVWAAYSRTANPAVLAIVNFPGLSSAYAQPFARDAGLLDTILQHAWAQSRAEVDGAAPAGWETLTLSAFSAGYGAVREILKSPVRFDQVDTIIAADSIYASLTADTSARQVDPVQMQDFLRFAQLACEGRKSLVISHSAQPTAYASTTETADYLLQKLALERRPLPALPSESWQPSTGAQRGRFLVWGFAGKSGVDHLRHLRQLDVLWQAVPPMAE